MFDAEQMRQFKRQGYLVLEDAIEQSVIDEAHSLVWDELPVSPDSSVEEMAEHGYGNIPEVQKNEPFFKIRKTLFDYAEALVGKDSLVPKDEIDIPYDLHILVNYPQDGRWTNTHLRRMTNYSNGAPGGHIDGYGINFKDKELDRTFRYWTIAAAVYLTRVDMGGGGFTVFPGSHWIAQKYYQEHTVESPGWMGALPAIDDSDSGGDWQYDKYLHDQLRSKEITGPPGTVTFYHQRLLHGRSLNQRDIPRVAAFTRYAHENGESIMRDAPANIWKYWEAMDDIEVDLENKPIEL